MTDATVSTQTNSSSTTKSSALAQKVEAHDIWLKVILAGVALAIITLAVDLYQDRATYNTAINTKGEVLDKYEILLAKQIVLESKNEALEHELKLLKQCLRFGGWNSCFLDLPAF